MTIKLIRPVVVNSVSFMVSQDDNKWAAGTIIRRNKRSEPHYRFLSKNDTGGVLEFELQHVFRLSFK